MQLLCIYIKKKIPPFFLSSGKRLKSSYFCTHMHGRFGNNTNTKVVKAKAHKAFKLIF